MNTRKLLTVSGTVVVVVLAMLAPAAGLSQAQGLPSFPHTDETNTILRPQQQCPDPYEPNDSFGQAWNLVPPGTLHSYVCSVSDLDYFSLSANVGDTIYLTLYDPAQSLITCSNNSGATKEVIEETANVTILQEL